MTRPPFPPQQEPWQSPPQPSSQLGWQSPPQPPSPSIWQRGWKPPSKPSSQPIPHAPEEFTRLSTVILAGFFDQVAWLGMFPFFLGSALWLGFENAAIGPIVGTVAAIATLIANSILAHRRRFSIGMFIVGIRISRNEPIDYLDVLSMFVDFWIDLVRFPLWWLYAKLTREPLQSAAVYDARAWSSSRRLARVLLAVLDLLLLLPMVLWIFG